MKSQIVVTKQMLLSMCLCDNCRYHIYRNKDGSIYIIDTTNHTDGFYIQFVSNRILVSSFSVVVIKTYDRISSIDALKKAMDSHYKF
jgi:hypothetical protein